MNADTGVRLIRSKALAPAPYAYASIVPAGTGLVFLAGACPLDAAGMVTPLADIEGQAVRCLDNLELALTAAGAELRDVVSTRVLVVATESAQLSTAWRVVEQRFGTHDVPSTLIGVSVLGYPGQLVEIEAIAAVAESTEVSAGIGTGADTPD
jgi:enamine deaminase RidA (YjgF/YER057c/UK114 family)